MRCKQWAVWGAAKKGLLRNWCLGLALTDGLITFRRAEAGIADLCQCVREIAGDPAGLEVRVFRKG